MPLHFVPQRGAAVDRETGLTIYAPRMLPASFPENPEHTEYQYNLHRNGDRFYGLGLCGTNKAHNHEGKRELLYTLDLGRDWIFDSVFGLKRELANDEDDFTFLRNIAQGLIAVFYFDNNDYGCHYCAYSDATVLTNYGICIPDNVEQKSKGEIVLAEEFVPAHIESDAT